MAKQNRYQKLIEKIFFDGFEENISVIPFERAQLESSADELKNTLPKNLGNVIYSMRYRASLPQSIIETQPSGMEWIIEGAGRARYVFKLVPIN